MVILELLYPAAGLIRWDYGDPMFFSGRIWGRAPDSYIFDGGLCEQPIHLCSGITRFNKAVVEDLMRHRQRIRILEKTVFLGLVFVVGVLLITIIILHK